VKQKAESKNPESRRAVHAERPAEPPRLHGVPRWVHGHAELRGWCWWRD